MFDVIVSGAGPAGAVAGTVLARGGARVLLVDRARFPRDKLCGDTLNPGAIAVLRRLGLTGAFESLALPVDGMIVTGERGVRVSAPYEAGARGMAMVRRDLDSALLRAAAAAGARVEENVLVRGPLLDTSGAAARVRGVVLAGRDGKDLRVPAPLVIAADGRRSRLALALGLTRHPLHPRRWAVGAYFEGVMAVTSFGEMHVRRAQYVGVARVPSGLTNVCLVSSRQEGLDDPTAVLRTAIEGDEELRDRFSTARMVTSPVVLGPLAVDAAAPGAPGLLLAGDAAGFIDPMTGDGLRFAVRGGELAALVALAVFAGKCAAPHTQLARARRREFAGKWRFNRALRRLVDGGVTVQAAGLVASAAPWILRRTIAYAGDVPRRAE